MPIYKNDKLEGNRLYKILNDWHTKPDILLLIKAGVIDMVFIDWLTIFNYYQEQTVGDISDRIQQTSDEFNVSERTVRRALKFFGRVKDTDTAGKGVKV